MRLLNSHPYASRAVMASSVLLVATLASCTPARHSASTPAAAATITVTTSPPAATPTKAVATKMPQPRTTTSSSPSEPITTPAVTACVAASVRITATLEQPASHNDAVLLSFINISSKPCRTFGYPGVAVLSATGKQKYQAIRTPSGYFGGLLSGQAPKFTLAPGQRAAALVQEGTTHANGDFCPHASALLVTMPDDTASTHVAVKVPDCGKVEINPILPGTTGTQR